MTSIFRRGPKPFASLFNLFHQVPTSHRQDRRQGRRHQQRRLNLERLEQRAVLTAGDLDLTFGVGGMVTTNFLGNSVEAGSDVAIQADGKIIVAGASNHSPAPWDFAVVRYNSDGSLDNSFGTDGKQTVDFDSELDLSSSVAIQPDGKIVLAGSTRTLTGSIEFAVARLTTTGALDLTFNGTGKQTIDFGFYGVAEDLVVQPDGKIVVVGHAAQGAGEDFAVARLNSDGSLDNSFGTGGKQTLDFGLYDAGLSTVLQSDGKIVVAGFTSDGGPSYTVATVARLNIDGTPDNTFDGDGKLTVDLGPDHVLGYDVALQAGGKILLAGYVQAGADGDFAVVRLNADGSLDSSFGISGQQTVDFGDGVYASATAMAVLPDGKIVLAGSSFVWEPRTFTYQYYDEFTGELVTQEETNIVQIHDFAVAQLTSAGELDTSFGNNGTQTVDFGSDYELNSSVALQADGKILLAGFSSTEATVNDFAVARLLGDEAPTRLVTVDILPESLNVDSNGTLTVLIYGGADFNAAQIDVSSVRFAGASAWQSNLVDRNGDGHLDLQLKFRRQDTVLDQIYAELLVDDQDADGVLDSTRQTALITITGQTADAAHFSGSDNLTLFLSGRKLRELLASLFG